MRIGLEGNHLAGVGQRGWRGSLDLAREHGLDSVFFKSILDLSPTLDMGELREARAYADCHGMDVEVGIGRVNPDSTAESPHVRRLGGGDYRKTIEQMIHAGREIDCTELWAETATIKRDLAAGSFIVDCFRTDTTWEDQRAATSRFLNALAPLLRDLGCRVSSKTQEDVTSHRLVRLVESVGADLATAEVSDLVRLAQGCEVCIARREMMPAAGYAAIPFDDLAIPNILKSERHLRAILVQRGHTHSPPTKGASVRAG